MNKQKFIDKFIRAFLILVLLKVLGLVAQLFHQSFWSVLGTLGIFVAVAIIIFVVMISLKDKEKNDQRSGRRGNSGGNFYLENSLFDRIRSKYEELAEKYITEGDYKKAAKVYMNLLQDNYRAAKTLENGGFYNEAAVIYLKRLHNKSDAAACYEKAKQYRKAIDLYKELDQKEKVGDLYKEMNDIKNAHIYYQMLADDFVDNSQMVKASLIYRKKMEMPDEAQKILLTGWKENKDAFNCLNNYFANIFDSTKLEREIQHLYEETPADKKLIYLEAMKYEFKKNSSLQTVTRNIAYEIISEKVETHSEIVNELKYFNPDDSLILKDISRYKTGRNKMFRN
ncbi:tetratricopeptide repeat protein [Chryseobacterium sp. PTM-20240506]|uniref:tetratricopeptide repeat protein n=1 Tax=Chryseobacterium sp. PTM-20240506 TaxID=3400631 RepID=UPI003AACB82B